VLHARSIALHDGASSSAEYSGLLWWHATEPSDSQVRHASEESRVGRHTRVSNPRALSSRIYFVDDERRRHDIHAHVRSFANTGFFDVFVTHSEAALVAFVPFEMACCLLKSLSMSTDENIRRLATLRDLLDRWVAEYPLLLTMDPERAAHHADAIADLHLMMQRLKSTHPGVSVSAAQTTQTHGCERNLLPE
jgi:hypothetical protein